MGSSAKTLFYSYLSHDQNTIMCRCDRSLAVVCGLFASMVVALSVAEGKCGDGRVSNVAWNCETASGNTSSI